VTEASFQTLLDDFKESTSIERSDFHGMMSLFSPFSPSHMTSLPLQDSKNSYYMPNGLTNIANTCYLNSLMQALAGCPQFMAYVGKVYKHIKVKADEKDNILTNYLINLLVELQKGNRTGAMESLRIVYYILCEKFTE
jgi:ubiquitin C-terminal hydrolase